MRVTLRNKQYIIWYIAEWYSIVGCNQLLHPHKMPHLKMSGSKVKMEIGGDYVFINVLLILLLSKVFMGFVAWS